MLGICLGMQLLFERSEEEDTDCLGLIAGPGAQARAGAGPAGAAHGLEQARRSRDDGVGLRRRRLCLFRAQLRLRRRAGDASPRPTTAAPIPAAVRRGNWLGAQFHPERTGEAGARFLEAFLAS